MPHINLLPWREERRQKRQQRFISIAIFVGLAAVATWFAGNRYIAGLVSIQESRNTRLDEEIKKLDAQIAEIKSLKEQKARMVNRMEVIQQLQTKRGNVVHVFNELTAAIPDGIRLTGYVLKDDSNITLVGVSDATARVADLMQRIGRSNWFQTPSLYNDGIVAAGSGGPRSAVANNLIQGDRRADYSFQITTKVRGQGKDEGDNG